MNFLKERVPELQEKTKKEIDALTLLDLIWIETGSCNTRCVSSRMHSKLSDYFEFDDGE